MQWHTSISITQPKFGPWNWKALKSLKDINRIWKNYQNIRITPPTLWNRTFIPLYSNVPNFPAQSDTPQYQSKNQNLVSGVTCAIFRDGTFILLYNKVPNNPTKSDTPIMTHLYVIQTATIFSPELRNVIKGLWKKLRESEKITDIWE